MICLHTSLPLLQPMCRIGTARLIKFLRPSFPLLGTPGAPQLSESRRGTPVGAGPVQGIRQQEDEEKPVPQLVQHHVTAI